MTVLIVIRGNSGSGKSSVAREVRRRYGRGCALIEQDYLRRIVLREHDTTGLDGLAPQLIGANAKLALDNGYHVVLEGILFSGRYRTMLGELIAGHPGPSHLYYLDVSLDGEASTLEETVETILDTSGLRGAPAVAPCPARCPRCGPQ